MSKNKSSVKGVAIFNIPLRFSSTAQASTSQVPNIVYPFLSPVNRPDQDSRDHEIGCKVVIKKSKYQLWNTH